MTCLLAGAAGPRAGRARLPQLAAAESGSVAVERLSERLTVAGGGLPESRRGPPGRPRCLLDGALFNATELATELGLGPQESTEELLAAAYERHGTDVLGRLRGNFVLLVDDPRRERVLLACDQLGARSIFFKPGGRDLLFATEVHLLLRLLPARPAPDEAALIHWLAETAIPEGRTLYGGIERLGGGRLVQLDRDGVSVRRYWAPKFTEPAPISRAEAAELARTAMAAAVRRQMPDGERCGVLLSGGLDSSSVAALARREAPRELPIGAYSAVFPDHSSIDESEMIGEAAAGIGADRTSIAVRSGSMVRGSLEYLREWELPLPAPNHFLWQPLLSRAAADGNTCLLDGEGGDELWKFSPYLLADLVMSGRGRGALRTTREMIGIDLYRGRRSAVPYLRAYGLKGAVPAGVHRALRSLHSPQRYAPDWFAPDSAKTFVQHHDPWGWKRLDGPRWWAYMADLLTGVRERLGVGDYLRHRATMAGLGARHPLIDLELVELALGLPPGLAIDARRDRPVLRDAIEGLVPDSIRLRPGKSYFAALFHECLAGRDAALIRKLLTEAPEVGAYVDLEAVRRDLLDPLPPGGRRPPQWPWSVWRLVTAECWLRAQRDESAVERLLEDCAPRRDDWAISAAKA